MYEVEEVNFIAGSFEESIIFIVVVFAPLNCFLSGQLKRPFFLGCQVGCLFLSAERFISGKEIVVGPGIMVFSCFFNNLKGVTFVLKSVVCKHMQLLTIRDF